MTRSFLPVTTTDAQFFARRGELPRILAIQAQALANVEPKGYA